MQSLMAVDIAPIKAGAATNKTLTRKRLSDKDRALLMRQLSVLLQSGLTVEEALTNAAGDDAKPIVDHVLTAVRAEVTEGARLSDAMATAPLAFPPLVRSVAGAGEASGRLGEVTGRLATYLESSWQLKQKVRAALIYPILLAIIASLMVGALMGLVVPRLVEQFDVFGADLPLITRIVVSISATAPIWGSAMLIGVLVLIFGRKWVMQIDPIKRAVDRISLRLPVVGHLTRTVAGARFARVFATLASSGATVLESLGAARGAMTNTVFIEASDAIAEQVRQGGSFSRAMKATKVFPQMMSHLVMSGEAGRDVAGMMTRAAEFLEADFDTSSETALNLLEPMIIILLGGIIGLIVTAIMLPIIQLNTLALG
jgi:general secretion pathway protein F